jgi:predicted ATPase/class 3 adenylate cyclase
VAAPSGTVTFLFTDIEGYTRLSEAAPEIMPAALERHDAIVRSAIQKHDGYIFATGGDGFAAAFSRAGSALSAATAAQSVLAVEPWPEAAPLRVRMALHTGEATERAGDYFGTPVNQAARLMALGHGGQVLCSAVTAALVGDKVPLVDLGEHRLRDLSAPQRVFQLGERRFPPLRSVDAIPTNLPTMRNEMIGRSDDVAALAAVAGRERLVTLTGAGGVGKTRLALAIAAAVAPSFPDGCWLVELAAVGDGGEVAPAVASAIRAPVTGLDALVRYLSDRRALIVLDNCEHVLDAASELGDALLAAGPDVHVLATSREPLGVDGEIVRRVQSLGLPPSGASVVEAGASAAVRLFVERAAAARQGFALHASNVGPIVDICRHLDGIPLAIELAAARVGALPPAEIARRLDERFRLLGGGPRRAHERHRTLLAAVAWSYDLLTDEERVVFRRLAVFPASFDVDAGEAVAGGGGLDSLGCLVRLVERSLVQFDPDEGRYRLLETLRQYAAERLADAGETDAAQERHARFFMDLVARHSAALAGPGYPEARAVLTAELDNFRAVAEWCAEHGRWAELLSMCRQMLVFAWLSRADPALWYRRVLDGDPALGGQDRVDALGELGFLTALHLADRVAGEVLANDSEESRERGGLAASPWAGQAKALVAFFFGRNDEALRASRAALEAAELRHDEVAAVAALALVGNALAYTSLDDASPLALEALTRAERIGNPVVTANVALVVSSGLITTGTPDFAASLTVLSRYASDFSGGDSTAMWSRLLHGYDFLALGEPSAVEHFAEAARLGDRLNGLHVVDTAVRGLAVLAADAGYLRDAAALVGYADANLAGSRIRNPQWNLLNERVENAATAPGLGTEKARGAALKRGEAMALVADLEERLRRSEAGGMPARS